jgi:hypothetical protein
MRNARLAVIALVLSLVTSLQVRAKDKGFESQFLEITMGGIVMSPDVKPELRLHLANKSQRTLWVAVRFEPPAPNAACEQSHQIDTKQEGQFTCALESLVAEADHAATVKVFGDSGMTEQLETTSTSMRPKKKEVEAMQEWLEATRLPKTYESILLREDKVGLGTMMMGAFASGGGRLVVTPDGLEHVTKKKTVKVSAAQVRHVQVQSLGQGVNADWVVVDYEDAGTPKKLMLQGSVLKGGPAVLPRVQASLQAMLRRPGTTASSPGSVPGTAADASLQADIRATLQKLEAGTGSDCQLKLESAEASTPGRSKRYTDLSPESKKTIDDALQGDRMRFEIWRGTSCGVAVAYEVWLLRSPDGGTDVSATRLD